MTQTTCADRHCPNLVPDPIKGHNWLQVDLGDKQSLFYCPSHKQTVKFRLDRQAEALTVYRWKQNRARQIAADAHGKAAELNACEQEQAAEHWERKAADFDHKAVALGRHAALAEDEQQEFLAKLKHDGSAGQLPTVVDPVNPLTDLYKALYR